MGNAHNDPNKGARKFLFDLHNFDEPETAAEDAPAPPPSYTQEELEAARTLAFEQGRQKGLNESAASREQKVAQLLQQISTQFATLFAAEQERESRYEQEVLMLTLGALEKLFPAMNERIGGIEAQHAIRRLLKTAADQSEITIRIHPDFVPDIEKLVAPFRDKDINPPNFHIVGDEALGPGDCRLQWSDGGAVRDANQLSEGILAALTALLPEQAQATGAILADSGADAIEHAQGPIEADDRTDGKNNDINEEDRAESPSGDSDPRDMPGENDNE